MLSLSILFDEWRTWLVMLCHCSGETTRLVGSVNRASTGNAVMSIAADNTIIGAANHNTIAATEVTT